jgi:hypothetical protein
LALALGWFTAVIIAVAAAVSPNIGSSGSPLADHPLRHRADGRTA